MTKELIIIALIVIGLAYYYWSKPVTTQSTSSPDQSELNSKVVANLGNSIPRPEKPILSHKQRRQLKKKK